MELITSPGSYQVKKNIVVFSLLFTWILIAYLILVGNPANSLHQSALSWAFSFDIFVVAAYVFGVYLDTRKI